MMTSDEKNNGVFVSDLLETRHPAFAARLRDILDGHGIPLEVIRGTKDIGCRDYMPVPVGPGDFVRFRYAPDYLRGCEHLITRPADIGPIPEIKRCVDSEIVLDGGNVVGWGSRCIVTDKVFRENPALGKDELIGRLRGVLGVDELIVIPTEPYDVVGHADGLVRFLDERTVVINDYRGLEPAYGRTLRSIFRQHGLECVEVPYFVEDHATDGIPSAAGCYVNYLRLGKRLILPVFGVAQDDAALRKFESLFSGTRIVPLPCIELAREGGCLHCISWTIRAGECPRIIGAPWGPHPSSLPGGEGGRRPGDGRRAASDTALSNDSGPPPGRDRKTRRPTDPGLSETPRLYWGERDHLAGKRQSEADPASQPQKPGLQEQGVSPAKETRLTTNDQKTDRTIAIGDIHGCARALAALIEAIQPGPQDEIVTLGDHIDGGPDSRGVLDQLLALSRRSRLVPLMGNHEQMLLAALDSRSERAYWLKFGGDATLASYDRAAGPEALPNEHLEFVRSCRPYHETDAHIFVHASYWPNMPMAELSSTVLYWEPLQPERAARHYSGKTVIVGHTPQPGGQILDLGFLKCIDTDCCRGGCLTALEVGTGRIWQTNQRGELVD